MTKDERESTITTRSSQEGKTRKRREGEMEPSTSLSKIIIFPSNGGIGKP